jgi:hypothetical protein
LGQLTFEHLNAIFSKARISPYFQEGDDAHGALAKYNANITLSEAMIPTLHYFEICLRNRIDQIIKKYYTENWHRKDTIKIIFPNLPRIHRKRSYIEHKLLQIKEIRNRIAHHKLTLHSGSEIIMN